MLSKIRISNFKSLRNFVIDPGRFNVIVGPNDVGKTSFIESLDAFSSIIGEGSIASVLKQDFSFEDVIWKGDEKGIINFVFSSEKGVGGRSFKTELAIGKADAIAPYITNDRLVRDGNPIFQTDEKGILVSGSGTPLYQEKKRTEPGLHSRRFENDVADVFSFFKSFEIFKINPADAKKTVPFGKDENLKLESSGFGLARVLDYLNRKKRDVFLEIENNLVKIVPSIRRITLNHKEVWVPDGPAIVDDPQEMSASQSKLVKKPGVSIGFVLDKGWEVPAPQISDGVILFLAYLTVSFFSSEAGPSVILADEPENGIHPRRVQDMLGFFRKLSEGFGNLPPVQVFLTTHSPYLVDFLEPEELHIFHRDPQEGTTCIRTSDIPDISKRLTDQYLGELWFNVGEKDLVAKGRKVKAEEKGCKDD